ncbi:hypothetical protein A2U01_0053078, partial [Trifolium medium]|nr:hypothetical protein [Trifolium medium]
SSKETRNSAFLKFAYDGSSCHAMV